MCKWYRYCLALLYPLECVICNCSISLESDNSQFLCSDCSKRIKFISPPVCEKCGRPFHSTICSKCSRDTLFFDTVRSVALYDGPWKELIYVFKYRRGEYLDRFLAEFIVRVIEKNQFLKRCDFLIPVPLYWLDRRRRGYNQASLLASQIGKLTSIPLLQNVLIKCKKVPSQTKLSMAQRLKNVTGAFTVRNPGTVKDKKILLIDDVFTTGSTANECAKVLKNSGASRVHVVTLARGL